MARAGAGTGCELSCPACAAELQWPCAAGENQQPQSLPALRRAARERHSRGKLAVSSCDRHTPAIRAGGRHDAGVAQLDAADSGTGLLAGHIRRIGDHARLRRVCSGRPALAPQRDQRLGRTSWPHWAASGFQSSRRIPTATWVRSWPASMRRCSSGRSIRLGGGWASNRPGRCG